MRTQPWLKTEYRKGRVSIIIPTYNRASFLGEALDSVVKQSYRPIECIVVDDGSTDETEEVLQRFAKLQSRDLDFIYLKQANAGAQVARNKGTAASTGEFIQYLDSDDLLYPEKIKAQVNFLIGQPDCDCVFGNWEKGEIENRNLVTAYKSEKFVQQIVTLEKPLVNFSFLMRRSVITLAGPWDPTLRRMQEIDFQLKALIAGVRFEYQPTMCGLWRHHTHERIHNTTTVKDMIPFFQKWERILKEKGMFHDDMGKAIAGWYMWFVSQSKKEKITTLLPVLEETVRLNPSIPFYKTKKMRLLHLLLGQKRALSIWMLRYRNT